ncbi:hypothetical protein ABIB62_001567 [Mucilaginibacter sp. UYP25]|uniref:hypothetical protein n=1 Tax=unclassified Mucilaginibacter TaxID=2617802 RepID=UPI0033937D0A
MPIMDFNCPSCGKAWRAYVDKNISFDCSNCGLRIKPNENGKIDIVNNTKPSAHTVATEKESLGTAGIVILIFFAVLIICGIGSIYEWNQKRIAKAAAITTNNSYKSQNPQPTNSLSKLQDENANQKQMNPDVNPTFIIYSGNCTCYKKTIENNNTRMRYTPISEGFGKLVIGSNKKSFKFYYKDQLVFSKNEYDSYFDEEGGQGFTSDGSADAHRFIAEKKLDIEYNGYQFEILNYKEN